MPAEAEFPQLTLEGYEGRQLGRFRVLCKLGSGGMSEVLLAVQKSVAGFARPVVLKRVLDSVRHHEDFLHMFIQEAKICASLSHGHIAQLFDLTFEDGELFMVMEFVPGATLVEVARACAIAQEPIPIGFTVGVVLETAQALEYAHGLLDPLGTPRPVIHRDIAEKNIMVASDGTTKLLDFGIARQEGRVSRTMVGTVKGTAGYMSPEQVRGETLDGRSDLFSLGVVLHECLTGQRLFRRTSRTDEIQALLEEPIHPPSVKNPEVTPALDQVVLKALARDRKLRFGSAKELADALHRAAGARAWDQAERGRFMRRHFMRRLEQLQSLLGDPSKTNLDDVLIGIAGLDGRHTVDMHGPEARLRAKPEAGIATVSEVSPRERAAQTAKVRDVERTERGDRLDPRERGPEKAGVSASRMKPVAVSNVAVTLPPEPRTQVPFDAAMGATVRADALRPDQAQTLSGDESFRGTQGNAPTVEHEHEVNSGEGATVASVPTTRPVAEPMPADLRMVALGGVGAVVVALAFYALFELLRRL